MPSSSGENPTTETSSGGVGLVGTRSHTTERAVEPTAPAALNAAVAATSTPEGSPHRATTASKNAARRVRAAEKKKVIDDENKKEDAKSQAKDDVEKDREEDRKRESREKKEAMKRARILRMDQDLEKFAAKRFSWDSAPADNLSVVLVPAWLRLVWLLMKPTYLFLGRWRQRILGFLVLWVVGIPLLSLCFVLRPWGLVALPFVAMLLLGLGALLWWSSRPYLNRHNVRMMPLAWELEPDPEIDVRRDIFTHVEVQHRPRYVRVIWETIEISIFGHQLSERTESFVASATLASQCYAPNHLTDRKIIEKLAMDAGRIATVNLNANLIQSEVAYASMLVGARWISEVFANAVLRSRMGFGEGESLGRGAPLSS